MKIAVVYNQKSGGNFTKDYLSRQFQDNSIEVQKWIPISKELEHDLKKCILDNPKMIIAVVGGDGSMNGVAKVLGSTSAVLAPMPGGTLNHFAQDLGVPLDIDEAIRDFSKRKVKRIDYGTINSIVFCNNAGLGIYPRSLVEREAHEPRLGKWIAAVRGVFVSLVKFRSYKLQIDGRTVRTPFVFIGNNRYDFEKGISSRELLDEGVLTMYVALAHYRWQFFMAVLAACIGKTYRLRRYEDTSFHIESKHSMLHVSHDGELSQVASPLEVAIEKKKLNVLV